MILKGRHIGRLFTLIAGLIILAHAVVPHHHHFELANSLEQDSTCESPSQEKSKEEPVSHCSAFNVLVSEKISNSSVNQALSDYFSFFLPGIIANIEIPPFKNITTTIFGYQAIFLKQYFISAQSLRAPPAYA